MKILKNKIKETVRCCFVVGCLLFVVRCTVLYCGVLCPCCCCVASYCVVLSCVGVFCVLCCVGLG